MPNAVVIAWCELKIAECDQRVAMAKMVGIERAAADDARDARYFRAIVAALAKVSQQQGTPQADGAKDSEAKSNV